MKTEDLLKPTVAIGYVLLSLELAAEHDIARETLLKDLDISPALLARPDARVSFLQYGRLCARILRKTGDMGIGYEFGLRSSHTLHGFISLGALSQPDVRAAIEFASRFAPRMRSPGFDLHFFIDGEQAVINLSETVQYGLLHQFAVDMQLISVAASLHSALALALPALEIWFACPEPAHYARYRERLPPVRFNMGANQVRLPVQCLDQPLPTANGVTAELVRDYCEREAGLLDVSADLPSRVRALLISRKDGYPDLSAAAAELRLSTRTLKRHLHEHGFSFQRLIDEARQRDAIRLLKETSLSIEQIAEHMGYSEAGNFARAFRRLTGMLPGDFRMQQASVRH